MRVGGTLYRGNHLKICVEGEQSGCAIRRPRPRLEDVWTNALGSCRCLSEVDGQRMWVHGDSRV